MGPAEASVVEAVEPGMLEGQVKNLGYRRIWVTASTDNSGEVTLWFKKPAWQGKYWGALSPMFAEVGRQEIEHLLRGSGIQLPVLEEKGAIVRIRLALEVDIRRAK